VFVLVPDSGKDTGEVLSRCAAPLTFLHGVEQVVEVLRGLFVLGLHLRPVVGAELLRVLAVALEVLVVELKVPDQQAVLVGLHALKLQQEEEDGEEDGEGKSEPESESGSESGSALLPSFLQTRNVLVCNWCLTLSIKERVVTSKLQNNSRYIYTKYIYIQNKQISILFHRNVLLFQLQIFNFASSYDRDIQPKKTCSIQFSGREFNNINCIYDLVFAN